jgi:cyclophilin family peptidyl-prolyl cis-trans isomerase
MIRFETTHGPFTVELYEREAPLTVANFQIGRAHV